LRLSGEIDVDTYMQGFKRKWEPPKDEKMRQQREAEVIQLKRRRTGFSFDTPDWPAESCNNSIYSSKQTIPAIFVTQPTEHATGCDMVSGDWDNEMHRVDCTQNDYPDPDHATTFLQHKSNMVSFFRDERRHTRYCYYY